jgi:hypothetical protein
MPRTSSLNADHKIHVPLSKELYLWLKEEAKRSRQPATVIAREALEARRKTQLKKQREADLAAFIEANAGTDWDYDPAVGEASLESLQMSWREKPSKPKRKKTK